MSDHFFVVTGGHGAGKTSLITELVLRRGSVDPDPQPEAAPGLPVSIRPIRG
ncbi:ATP-binding protein [Leisingera sp. S132]|uniref:ATP-binding protein n=1 Tax=Leisingera sp. S132 TaxID=2867016 RepID=UPI0021A3AAB0|nr:ATP-binding protein [Leisingera sp. S132]UWQ79947.1 ATP-binding protein [Leisingera sp. S132]